MCFCNCRRIVQAFHRSCCEVDRVDYTLCRGGLSHLVFPQRFQVAQKISMLAYGLYPPGRTFNPAWANPSRSSCFLRDNGSHVELPHPCDIPGTAHGTRHGITNPVLKSTRNSGSRTLQDTALKSAWNARSRMVPLSPARGLGSSVRSRTGAPGTHCGIMDVVLWPEFHAGCTNRYPDFWTGLGQWRTLALVRRPGFHAGICAFDPEFHTGGNVGPWMAYGT